MKPVIRTKSSRNESNSLLKNNRLSKDKRHENPYNLLDNNSSKPKCMYYLEVILREKIRALVEILNTYKTKTQIISFSANLCLIKKRIFQLNFSWKHAICTCIWSCISVVIDLTSNYHCKTRKWWLRLPLLSSKAPGEKELQKETMSSKNIFKADAANSDLMGWPIYQR